jgi:hypothetical protein
MAGSRYNLALLVVSTIIMAGVVWADFFSDVLAMM